MSPPHYRNDVHHPHDIICLYCRGHQDESEYIYFYIVYVSHLSSIDEYCRTFGSNTVILACLQTHIAHSILLHKKSINCNQTIYDSIRKLSYCNCFFKCVRLSEGYVSMTKVYLKFVSETVTNTSRNFKLRCIYK